MSSGEQRPKPGSGPGAEYLVNGDSSVGDVILHPPDPDDLETQVRHLAAAGLPVLESLLAEPRSDKGALLQAKIAMAALSVYGRLAQSTSARHATNVAMVKMLAANDAERRQYIAIAMPQHPLVKSGALAKPK
jgi:ABC-type sugar transport system substrate-binding protein